MSLGSYHLASLESQLWGGEQTTVSGLVQPDAFVVLQSTTSGRLNGWGDKTAGRWVVGPTPGDPQEMLRHLRDEVGLTAGDLGELLSVSRRSIQAWIVGRPMTPQHRTELEELFAHARQLRGDRVTRREHVLALLETEGKAEDDDIREESRRAVLDVEMLSDVRAFEALDLGENPAALEQLVTASELIEVTAPGRGKRYPEFQIDIAAHRLWPEVAEINVAKDAGHDAWAVASWWISAHPRLAGLAPRQLVGTDRRHDLLVLAGLRPAREASDVARER